MKKVRFLKFAGIVFLGALGLALAVSAYYLARRQIAVYRIEKSVSAFKNEYAPMRVMVLSKSGSSVSARCFLYDGDGREIASFERSWNGYELDVETLLVTVGGRVFAFPSRISADPAFKRSGTVLFGYYDRNGFPGVFGSFSLEASARSALSDLFFFLKTFGGASRDLRRLREFEVGSVYVLTVRSDGSVVFSLE